MSRLAVRMSDVVGEAPDFIWDERISLKGITLIEGDPDEGKSTVTVSVTLQVYSHFIPQAADAALDLLASGELMVSQSRTKA